MFEKGAYFLTYAVLLYLATRTGSKSNQNRNKKMYITLTTLGKTKIFKIKAEILTGKVT